MAATRRSAMAVAVAMLVAADVSAAQTNATRPIRMVVPFPPGGATDFVVRLVAQKLGDRIGRQVVADNRGGPSGAIGIEIVLKALPDGHTLLTVSNSYATNAAMSAKLSYDPVNGLTPISLLGIAPLVLVVHPAVQAQTVGELVALAKTRPGMLKYASSGTGSGPHLSGELLRSMAKVDIVHVPYKGSGPSLIETLGGQVEMTFISLLVTRPHIQVGRLRLIGVGTPKRLRAQPDVPSISETIPGFESTTWYATLGPPGLPAAMALSLSTEFARVVTLPEVAERLSGDGVEPVGSSPEALRMHLAKEIAKWRAVAQAAQVRMD